ncbi:28S ribosomal protein S5, mitochondrial-like [Acanthaster planci]|uniref:Small ribosomal subunit protein uS5m n=1 Tax=Acanthaster planci TaxID=133434 RepID=A0A8B7Y5X3_ACAPL|nr:28S ribosomal protein S5, mitochondrial-like [Acanthaster planci]
MTTYCSLFLGRLCVNFSKRLSVSGSGKLQACPITSNAIHMCAQPSRTLLPTSQVNVTPRRDISWYNTLTADQLWKGMLATTGKAQTKARGKRPAKRIRKDLNRGQVIGEGKASVAWPGLNAPVLKDRTVQTMHTKEPDPEREERLLQIRTQWDKKKRRSVPPEQRGWTSKSWGGRRLGPPDPIPGETFEGFDSSVITVRRVFNMTGAQGRKRSMSALVVVGNKNGAIGYAHGKAPDVMSALRKAKNKAANYLHYIERYDNHTVYHDIESKFQVTRVRIRKQNKGYGLRCHRILKEICRLAGIRDLYARVYGSTNPINLTVAFVNGLASQETHQQIADRKGLHVVEFRKECGALPIIVASPQSAAPRDDVEEEPWDKELPLEWKEERPRRRVSNFVREGTIFF